jgi:hypothetical protein
MAYDPHAAALLRRLLWAIYDKRVVRQAARVFKVHERTVQRWLKAERRIPVRVWSALRDLPHDRVRAIRQQMTRQQEEGERRIELCVSAGTEAKATYLRALHEERCRRDLRAEVCRRLNERRQEAARSALTAAPVRAPGEGAHH